MFNGDYPKLEVSNSPRRSCRKAKFRDYRLEGRRPSRRAARAPLRPGESDQVQFEPVRVTLDSTQDDTSTLGWVGSNGVDGVLKVGSVALLSREEEVELAARVQEGDEAAREHMIRANLRLVVKIARDYEHLGLPLADLISEGTIGLMKAVDKFEPAKGGKLSTYGSWWIKQQIRRALASQGRTIRLPVHVEGKLYRLGRAEAKLRNDIGRDATDEELAAELGIAPLRVARLRASAVRPTSLDAPLGEASDTTIAEMVSDERASTPSEQLSTKVDHERLRALLMRLTEREQRILRFRFGLDGEKEHTLEELGAEFGLTRERIRQLQNEAFKKLRMMMEIPQALAEAA